MTARFLFILMALLTLLDSMVGSLLFRITGSVELANVLLFAKYVIFGAGFVLFMGQIAAGDGFLRHEIYGLFYLVVVGSLIVVLTISHPEHAAASRFYSYVFPVIIYFFGAWIARISSLDWRDCVKIYLTIHLLVTTLFGIPVYLFGAEFFWKDIIDYGNYIIRVKGFDDVIGYLPGNFYYDPYFTRVLRFVGSLGDPLAMGYSSMILAIVSWFAFPRARYFLVPALLLFILLAITRAAFLGFLVGVIGFWFLRRHSFRALLAVCVAGVVGILQFGDTVATFLGDSSTEGHVQSIGQIDLFTTPAALLGGTLLSGKSTVFEPGFMNILFSFGVVPLALLIAFMAGIFRQHANETGPTQFVSALMLAGVLTLTVFSPSFFAITSGWFAWFIAGLTSRPRAHLVTRTMYAVPRGGTVTLAHRGPGE